MSITQNEKAQAFAALHRGPTFVIPNPWDIASARALADFGFVALATSSGASGWALGRREGELTRDETLAHARSIVAATDLPVSVDLERRVRRCARGGGGDDSPRREHGSCRRFNRRCNRRKGAAAIRHRARDRACRGGRRGRAFTSVHVHADGARRELSVRSPRSR